MATIDETTARIAWEGIHMSDYKPGQAADELCAMCADALEAATEATKRAPERCDEIERLYNHYVDRATQYINERNRIDAMCPSVLIVGGANFPTKKKNAQNARMDAFYKKDWGFDKLLRKLRTIGTERETVKSNDTSAIDKLRAKLAKREDKQQHMKAVNAAIRLKNQSKGNERLHELGYDDDQINNLRTGANDFCGRPGFPPYMLQNNNAEIRRIKKRIETLEREKEAATQGNNEHDVIINDEHCKVVENADDMRLQIFFDDKPNADTRQQVKRAGFRWAPSIGAWQRQLTNNARHSLRQIATYAA